MSGRGRRPSRPSSARVARALPFAALVGVVGIGRLLLAFDARLDPARAYARPSVAHLLGCGEGGVDLASLVVDGALRTSALALAVALLAFAIGTPLGAAAALAGGRFERAVDRACDLVQALPGFLLALAVLAVVRHPTRLHLGIVFLATSWASFARLALVEARVLRRAAFVEAARALGGSRARVVFRHVVPNLLGTVAVQVGSTASAIVVGEAALAFVGLAPEGSASLGAVLDQGAAAMLVAPHVLLVGAGAVAATSLALLSLGRALDPPR